MLRMFSLFGVGRQYGITGPLIDVDRGLYEPVGIQEVPAFHSKKKTSCGRLFCIFQLHFLMFREEG